MTLSTPGARASTPQAGSPCPWQRGCGAWHSTLTLHRQQEGVDRVLAFFEEKLR